MQANLNFDLISIVCMVISVFALLTIFWEKTIKRQRYTEILNNQTKGVLEKTERLTEKTEQLISKVENSFKSNKIVPIWSYLSKNQNWKFLQKALDKRDEKENICQRIVTNYIKSNSTILLDSGSTVDLITSELLVSQKSAVHIVSNNVFAAVNLAGEKDVTFRLLSGVFDDFYAATYSKEAIEYIEKVEFHTIILATTLITYEEGVMVRNFDKRNIEFKKTALKKFIEIPSTHLIIAVDGSKLIAEKENHVGVLNKEYWDSLLKECHSRMTIVTTPLDFKIDAIKRAEFERQIDLFKKAGIGIDMPAQRELL